MTESLAEGVSLVDEFLSADADRPAHYVKVGVANETDVEFERCWYTLEGCHLWDFEGIKNDTPPERLKPDQSFTTKLVSNFVGVTIDVVVAYKKVGDGNRSEDQIVYVHIHSPLIGENNYYNSGLREKAQEYGFYLEERGNFRRESTGADGNNCDAFFHVKSK